MRIRITYSGYLPVSDLSHYEADTLEQAARNLADWYEDGSAAVHEDLESLADTTLTVEAVI